MSGHRLYLLPIVLRNIFSAVFFFVQMMQNPQLLQQLMDNPMIRQLMSNPDVMRQLIMGNPQMRELMERNPEITHMLNNPELMRQVSVTLGWGYTIDRFDSLSQHN